MALSDMVVFNSQVQRVATETVDQSVRKFNEASGGALVLGNEQHIGDYLEEASYKIIASLSSRRNAYGSGGLSDQALQQLKDVSVKVDGRVGPVVWTSEQFRRLGKDEEEAGLIIGEQAAEAMIQDYLNTAASALVAAITQQAALVHDGTGGNVSLSALNKGARKFGDRSQALVAWLMHGDMWHDLIDEAITNTNQLFNIGNINVIQDGLGRRYVVTDSPALITSGSPDTYHTVGLVSGAVQVQTSPLDSVVADITGDENLKKRWQGEYNFLLGLKGYTWDQANGGKSPNDTALGTGTNWDKLATSVKDTAGVLVNTQ